jgi:hypothetical protein
MSVADTSLDGASGPPPLVTATGGVPRKRFWWAWLLGATVVALSVVGVLLGKAAAYQPVGWGDMESSFPGMPTGVGIKVVNNFGLLSGGDYYVPPQRGVFSFGVTLFNNGSRPVIIEAANTCPTSSSRTCGVWLGGPVRYTTNVLNRGPLRIHVLRNVTLAPSQTILIGMPLRIWPCGQTAGWATDPAFYVKERFLFFTHTVALPWSMDGAKLIMHAPGGKPGDADTVCAPG